jgi:hypothetical protein
MIFKTASAPQGGIGVYPDLSGLRSNKLMHSSFTPFTFDLLPIADHPPLITEH